MSAIARRLSVRPRVPAFPLLSGIAAISVKELRGRMRGRRAFIIVTLYVLLLAVFAWMLQQMTEADIAGYGSYGTQATYASATVGRGIFVGLLLAQTLMVAVLAPAATAGAISGEREHQTLDLLAVTPISSFAIVVGKLLSALAWVFVLVLASIPVTALVFVFGGVGPDDVVRGYAVLFATVLGLGSVGIFFSALTRRTGASTGLTFVTTIALTIGSYYVFSFMSSTSEIGANGLRKQAPEAVLYLNPFIAQVDVACGTEDGGFGNACSTMSRLFTGSEVLIPPGIDPGFPVPGIKGGGVAPDNPVLIPVGPDVEANVNLRGLTGVDGAAEDDVVSAAVFDPLRDRFWPKTVISLLVLATVLTLASIQFVSPTRRWRPSLPGRMRRPIRRRSAP